MTSTLVSLNLKESNCANNGGDDRGIKHLCSGLLCGGGGLTELNLEQNQLNVGAAEAIGKVLKTNSVLQTLKCAATTRSDSTASPIPKPLTLRFDSRLQFA